MAGGVAGRQPRTLVPSFGWPDATGRFLRVEQFPFTGPSKSRAGYTMLAMCGTGRCTVYAPSEDEEATMHQARFLREVEVARYELRFNEQLSYRVPSTEGPDSGTSHPRGEGCAFPFGQPVCLHTSTVR
jgi:hypothetical protein